MHKIAIFVAAAAFVAATVLSRIEWPSITMPAQAVSDVAQGISPLDMHRYIDVKTLPVQHIDNLI